MTRRRPVVAELRLAFGFAGVAMIGFCVDASLLRLGLGFGLPAWGARIVSLFCAMQATFTINRLTVFRRQLHGRLPRQWCGYMLTNGFGNFCNYWIFMTLVSTHWAVISNHYAALAVGSGSAWLINFAGARLVAFRRVGAPRWAGPDAPSRGRGPA